MTSGVSSAKIHTMDGVSDLQNPVLPDLPRQPLSQAETPRKWFWMLLMVLLLLLVIVSLVFVVMPKKVHAPTMTPAPAVTDGVPQAAKTIDLAPNIPSSEKTVLTIENSDSSLEKIVLPTTQIEGYMHTLPQGTKVVSRNPAL